MAIDMHGHWVPPALAERLRRRRRPPRIEAAAGGERLRVYRETLPFGAHYTDMEARLALMDREGVRLQVLSLPGLFAVDSLPAAEAAPLVRLFNEATAALIRAHGGRFLGLAALPLADMEAAAAELARARRDLGLLGAILPADGFLDLARAAALRPLFDVGQRLGAHFFVHPGPLPENRVAATADSAPAGDNAVQRHIVLDVQARLSAALVTLALTDFLDPYPNVSIQVANLGGTLPFLLERMDHVAALRLPGEPPPSERMGRCHVDCASFGPRAIETAVAALGAGRVVLGTDCPVFDLARTCAAVAAAKIGGEARAALLHANAEALVGRLRKP